MQGLTVYYTPLERADLSREIERLFVMQDKHITEDKKSMIVSELEQCGLPFRAVVAGINKLCEEDVRNLKLITIIGASRAFVAMETPKGCEVCGRTGMVAMESPDGYLFAMACKCDLGAYLAKKQQLTRWNGFRVMKSRHGDLKLSWQYERFDIKDGAPDHVAKRQYGPTACGNTNENEQVAWDE